TSRRSGLRSTSAPGMRRSPFDPATVVTRVPGSPPCRNGSGASPPTGGWATDGLHLLACHRWDRSSANGARPPRRGTAPQGTGDCMINDVRRGNPSPTRRRVPAREWRGGARHRTWELLERVPLELGEGLGHLRGERNFGPLAALGQLGKERETSLEI